MEFLKLTKPEKKDVLVGMDKCQSGQVYEFIGSHSHKCPDEKPVDIENLRLCIYISGKKCMVDLVNGHSTNSNFSSGDAIYRHRTDIKLVQEIE